MFCLAPYIALANNYSTWKISALEDCVNMNTDKFKSVGSLSFLFHLEELVLLFSESYLMGQIRKLLYPTTFVSIECSLGFLSYISLLSIRHTLDHC